MSKVNKKSTLFGFSTINADRARSWRLYDSALIQRDLLNHFHTRVGERVMRPTWGCRIWEWLMEPLDDGLRSMIIEEAIRICREDTRVEVFDVIVTEIDHGLSIAISLSYPTTKTPETLSIEFEARQQTGIL